VSYTNHKEYVWKMCVPQFGVHFQLLFVSTLSPSSCLAGKLYGGLSSTKKYL